MNALYLQPVLGPTLSYAELSVPFLGKSKSIGFIPPPIKDVYQYKALDQALHRPHTDKVLGLKQVIVKPTAQGTIAPRLGGIKAHQGYSRHHDRGLAFDFDHPFDGPIMKQPDNQWAGMNSRIPDLK